MKLATPALGAIGAHDPALDQANAMIARRVRARRTSLGVTLAALATASGVDLSTLSDLEDRREGCAAADLWRIAQALGASLSELCQPAPQERRAEAYRTFGPDEHTAPPIPQDLLTRH